MSTRNAIDAAIANASSMARVEGVTFCSSAVMRMCSPRRSATTAPSIESQRKRIDASSSDHTSGAWNT
ncbi:hypothetical protein D9M72_351720 [compost metagenome]